ncbi:uncharacterized protein [Porites lutea]|uniref:uncharacterized protein n=1 Tax=Porites lutea TaxID=51062 RepID=UPI003CC6D4E6
MPPRGEEETLINHVEYLDKARTQVYDYEVITRGNAKFQNGLTLFTAAVFIVAQVAGSGVLALPAAIFTAFGKILFSFVGVSIFPTIQTDMKKASRFPLSVFWAYISVLAMYLPVSVLGFSRPVTYGRDITPNILDSVGRGENNNVVIISQVVLVLVSLQLLVSCVITLNPVSQQLEELCNVPRKFCFQRCILRTVLMCFILGIGELIPKFGPILSLIGGSTVTALTFVFPCLFYLRIAPNVPLHVKAFLCEIMTVGIFGGLGSTYSAINEIRQVFIQ